MKNFLIALTIVITALAFSSYVTAEEPKAPPIAQPLVREGEFAVQLVETLKMMPAQTEAEAENMLTAAGIVPQKGWIADYPVTPDILSELEKTVQSAARSGAIGLEEEAALKAFEGLKRDVGLADVKDSTETYGESEPPASYDGDSPSAAAVDGYYETEGPPVVTYYPPPYAYYGLYGWVPYPFWYSGVFFSGFFILRDFHRPIFVHNKAFVVSNHFFDRHGKKVITVAPHQRFLRDTAISRGARNGGISGREGIRNGGNTGGNAISRPYGIERPGRSGIRSGAAFQSRGSGNNRSQPKSDRGRENFSSPGKSTENSRGAIRSGRDINRRTGGEVRAQRSFGGERRVISPSGRGNGGFSNSIIRQDRGGSTTFSGSRGGFFENRTFLRGGFSGSGGSFKGFSGGGGKGGR